MLAELQHVLHAVGDVRLPGGRALRVGRRREGRGRHRGGLRDQRDQHAAVAALDQQLGGPARELHAALPVVGPEDQRVVHEGLERLVPVQDAGAAQPVVCMNRLDGGGADPPVLRGQVGLADLAVTPEIGPADRAPGGPAASRGGLL